MKTKQLLFLGFLGLLSMASNAQNVSSTANLTSGGLNAGSSIIPYGANTYYGYGSGAGSLGHRNTYIGESSGDNGGSYNVCIGANTRLGWGLQSNNNVLIGANSGNEEKNLGSGNVFIGNNSGFTETESNNKLIIGNDENVQLIWGDFALSQLKLNGKVGIGTDALTHFGNFPTTAGSVNVSNYKLFVKGGILTEEVRVSLALGWADYVFNKNYILKPLNELENFITANGHLPNVPSEKEVKENGIELGEMSKIQQEKIEELTLYLIQQNKEIEELKVQLKALIEKKQ